jgi:hypothetical protein
VITPAISHRLARASHTMAGMLTISPQQWREISKAATDAASWEDIPKEYRALIEKVEARPDYTGMPWE